MMGGGVESPPPPIFIGENNRKINKIMHCVDFFCVVVLKICSIFKVFIYLSVIGRYNPPPSKLRLIRRLRLNMVLGKKFHFYFIPSIRLRIRFFLQDRIRILVIPCRIRNPAINLSCAC